MIEVSKCYGGKESFALVLESSQEERQSDWPWRERECFRAVRSLEDILKRSGQRGRATQTLDWLQGKCVLCV